MMVVVNLAARLREMARALLSPQPANVGCLNIWRYGCGPLLISCTMSHIHVVQELFWLASKATQQGENLGKLKTRIKYLRPINNSKLILLVTCKLWRKVPVMLEV